VHKDTFLKRPKEKQHAFYIKMKSTNFGKVELAVSYDSDQRWKNEQFPIHGLGGMMSVT
jgi:NRPS condensation-like uncharacterized protein